MLDYTINSSALQPLFLKGGEFFERYLDEPKASDRGAVDGGNALRFARQL